jgi:outer membrane protein assembly factor BamB
MMASMLRSWLVPAVLLGAAAGLITAWWLPEEVADAQKRVQRTMVLGASTVLALLAWLGCFAPLAARTRALAAGGALGVLVLLAAAFRIEGTSGNLVPILRLRWARGPDAPREASGAGPAADPSGGASFPQFLGPARDGRLPDARVGTPPRLLWKREVGAAWSGFAVAKGRAVTQEQVGPEERVAALDPATGRTLWSTADAARYDTPLGGIGPRATPAIDGDRVFALGATGILNALDLATGARIWRAELGLPPPDYGFAGSPLVDAGRVLVQAGSSLLAFDRGTGKRLWEVPTDGTSYASPQILTLAGVRQIVLLNHASCTGHDAATGAPLWRHAWRGQQPKVAQPVAIGGDRLVISAGYGVGADAFRVTPSGTEPLWTSPRLKAKFSNFVHHAGHLYGIDDGRLVCVNADTGERAWAGERTGHGQLLLAGGTLVVSMEGGELLLADAVPEGYRERLKMPVLGGRTWNGPALAGRCLLLRNDREAACLELP